MSGPGLQDVNVFFFFFSIPGVADRCTPVHRTLFWSEVPVLLASGLQLLACFSVVLCLHRQMFVSSLSASAATGSSSASELLAPRNNVLLPADHTDFPFRLLQERCVRDPTRRSLCDDPSRRRAQHASDQSTTDQLSRTWVRNGGLSRDGGTSSKFVCLKQCGKLWQPQSNPEAATMVPQVTTKRGST